MQDNRGEPDSLRDTRSLEPRRVTQSYVVWRQGNQFSPPADIFELADYLIVLVEIAGMRTSDFHIALLERSLVISGQRERPVLDSPAYFQVEIGYGEFRIEVAVPWSVKRDEINAAYKDGFLRVELPKRHVQQVNVVDNDSQKQEK